MRYAIVGSRTWTKRIAITDLVCELSDRDDRTLFLTGDCPTGVDAMVAEEWPPATVYAADWLTYGKAAGPIRNKQLVADADVVYVFRSPGRSPGSDDVIRHALRLRKELHVYHERGRTT